MEESHFDIISKCPTCHGNVSSSIKLEKLLQKKDWIPEGPVEFDNSDLFELLKSAIIDENIPLKLVLMKLKDNKCLVSEFMDLDWKPLFLAVSLGNLEAVDLLLEYGLTLDQRNADQQTILHFATFNGNIEMVKHLLKKGVDINALGRNNRTLLHFAVESGKLEMVKLFVELGVNLNSTADCDITALYTAVQDKNYEIAEYLMDHDVFASMDIFVPNAPILLPPLEDNRLDIVRKLLEKWADYDDIELNDGTTILDLIASKLDDSEESYLLLDTLLERFDEDCVDKNSLKLVHHSVRKRNKKLLLKAIEIGLDVNYKDKKCHETPIFYAKNFEIIEILLNNGADIEARNDFGRTPFLNSICNTNYDAMEVFVKAGANMLATDNEGRTALHSAVIFKRIKELERVIELGLDVNAADKNGNTPLHLLLNQQVELKASDDIYLEMAEILLSAGADIHKKSKSGKSVNEIISGCKKSKFIKQLLLQIQQKCETK